MPVTVDRKEYLCQHCNRLFAVLNTCEEHESVCLEEQEKHEDIRKRMLDIDVHKLILFYAKSSEEIDDYVYGYADDYSYESFDYPTLVLIRKYTELDYEGRHDTCFMVTEFDQYVYQLFEAKNDLLSTFIKI